LRLLNKKSQPQLDADFSYFMILLFPLLIRLRHALRIRNFIGFLVGGKRNRNPVTSVINPGVNKSVPPIKIQIPSKRASPGI
jgi:hypothetical protein